MKDTFQRLVSTGLLAISIRLSLAGLVTTMAQPAKRAKTTEEPASALPSSVIVQFSKGGEHTGPLIDLPVDSSTQQLEELINTLTENEERVCVRLRSLLAVLSAIARLCSDKSAVCAFFVCLS